MLALIRLRQVSGKTMIPVTCLIPVEGYHASRRRLDRLSVLSAVGAVLRGLVCRRSLVRIWRVVRFRLGHSNLHR